jgi:hypothetical protein
MRLSRRTFASLALPCALLLTSATAASAQAAITITSFAHSPTEDYTNDPTLDVYFSGAGSFDTVTLEVGGDVIGSTVSDGSGFGTVTQEQAIESDPMDDDVDGNPIGNRYGLTVRDPDGGSLDTVTVHINQVPSVSASDEAQLAADASVYVSNAIPDEDVRLYIDGTFDKAVPADENGTVGNVKPDRLLTPGTHTASARSLDRDGHQSSPGAPVDFDVAPPAPAFSQFFDGVQLNQAQPVVAFSDVDPDATDVTLYEIDDNGDEVQVGHTASVTSGGTATITPSALSDGRHYLVAKQTVGTVETVDSLGNNGPITAVVNTSAPVLETAFDGTLTDWNTPYFHASNALENNDETRHTFTALYVDGQRVGTSDPDDNGGDSSSVQADDPIADGAHTAYVTTIDHLGHESATHSNTVAFTIDTVAPAPPTVTSPANGSTTATSLPVITVTTEPGVIAHVLVDDVGEEADQTADANGHVTFTLTQALADGGHTLHVWSRDAAGNYGDLTATTFTVATPKAPPVVTPPVVTPPVVTTPKNPVDLDGDGITNNWLVGGKAAPAPATPKAKVSSDKVELKLAAAPKGATKVRVYRADGKGGYKLVKTLTAKSKTFTDKSVKAGHTYKYKTVGVNAKGQQGKASGTATAKIKKKK